MFVFPDCQLNVMAPGKINLARVRTSRVGWGNNNIPTFRPAQLVGKGFQFDTIVEVTSWQWEDYFCDKR